MSHHPFLAAEAASTKTTARLRDLLRWAMRPVTHEAGQLTIWPMTGRGLYRRIEDDFIRDMGPVHDIVLTMDRALIRRVSHSGHWLRSQMR